MGLCLGGSLSRGSLSGGGVCVQGEPPVVTCGQYASFWNAFLFTYVLTCVWECNGQEYTTEKSCLLLLGNPHLNFLVMSKGCCFQNLNLAFYSSLWSVTCWWRPVTTLVHCRTHFQSSCKRPWVNWPSICHTIWDKSWFSVVSTLGIGGILWTRLQCPHADEFRASCIEQLFTLQ